MFDAYIAPVILVICMCVGYIVKNVIPNQKINRFIPLIAGTLGVLLSMWLSMAITPEVICIGLVSGLASTGCYELLMQLTKKDEI